MRGDGGERSGRHRHGSGSVCEEIPRVLGFPIRDPERAAADRGPELGSAGRQRPVVPLTKERPNPVVLLNATATTQWAYNAGAPYLANNGYCVYTFNYGNITPIPTFPIQGLADIERSGREISRQIDRILRRTGAKKVDLVGWSQGGGLLPHYYIDFLGGDKKVDKLIGIAPGNHESTGDMLTYVRYFIPPFGPVGYEIFKALFPAFAQQA